VFILGGGALGVSIRNIRESKDRDLKKKWNKKFNFFNFHNRV
jgi:hypothetical protein